MSERPAEVSTVTKKESLSFKEIWPVIKRLSKYVESDWYLILLGVVSQLGNSATTLSFPWLIGLAQDKAGKGHTYSQFKNFLLGGSAVLLVASLSSWLRVYCCGYATDRISSRLKRALYGCVLDQDIQYFDESKSGEILTILDKDVSEASELLTEQLINLMRAFNSSVNGSILLFIASPKLCGITLACVPFIGVGGTLMHLNNVKKKTKMREIEAATLNYVVERIQSISTVRLHGKEELERRKYSALLQDKLSLSRSVHSGQGAFMSFTNFSGNLSLGVLLGVGGAMVGRGEITAGDLSKFAMQSAFVGLGFSSLVRVQSSILNAVRACKRVFATMDSCSDITHTSGILHGSYLAEDAETANDTAECAGNSGSRSSSSEEWESSTSPMTQSTVMVDLPPRSDARISEDVTSVAVTLQDVHFTYNSRPDREILRGVDLCIPDKSITVIVGRNGSGKSTLHGLLCGLYPATEGCISLSTARVRSAADVSSGDNLEWIRAQVGVVEQSAKLLSGSIKDNILYGTAKHQTEITQDDVERVCRDVNAHEFIKTLPAGYRTEVGEGGHLLSGGQRARIALARALLKNPSVLVLDEPSASLDSESEQCLVDLLLKFKNEKSIVVFTHSAAIMQIADRIHLLDQGKIAVTGTYDELIGRCTAEHRFEISAALGAVVAGCK